MLNFFNYVITITMLYFVDIIKKSVRLGPNICSFQCLTNCSCDSAVLDAFFTTQLSFQVLLLQ